MIPNDRSPRTVADLMHRQVFVVPRGMYAGDALAWMREQGIRHAVVTSGKQIVGVLSARDLAAGGVHHGRVWRVEELATVPAVVVSPDAPLHDAARILRMRRIGCLPVVRGSDLVGIVTRSDLLRVLEDESERELPRTSARASEIPRPVRCASPMREKAPWPRA